MCLFCQIINKEVPSSLIYEDEDLVAFKDINPQAPVHILVVPKKHIESVASLERDDLPLLVALIWRAKVLAEKFGIAKSGYKLVLNSGKDAGQVVLHLHLHLLGGVALKGLV